MNHTAQTEVARVSGDVWRKTRDLAASFAEGPPPVPLEKLATACGIQRIRFAPLLSNAGLAKSREGLDIVVNTDLPGVPNSAAEGTELRSESISSLPPGLRFTVAHEIAHAVFLQVAGGDSRGTLFQKNAQAVENACNILARVLLSPEQMLVREIGNRLFDVDHVQGLLAAFRVSPEVFIWRLGLTDLRRAFTDLDGVLAFVQEPEGSLGVRACHIIGYHALARFDRALNSNGKRNKHLRHRSLSQEFRQAEWALDGKPITALRLGYDLEPLMRSSERGQKKLDVLWRSDEEDIIPCEMAFCRIHTQPLGFLVSLRVTAPKQKRAQHTLL